MKRKSRKTKERCYFLKFTGDSLGKVKLFYLLNLLVLCSFMSLYLLPFPSVPIVYRLFYLNFYFSFRYVKD